MTKRCWTHLQTYIQQRPRGVGHISRHTFSSDQTHLQTYVQQRPRGVGHISRHMFSSDQEVLDTSPDIHSAATKRCWTHLQTYIRQRPDTSPDICSAATKGCWTHLQTYIQQRPRGVGHISRYMFSSDQGVLPCSHLGRVHTGIFTRRAFCSRTVRIRLPVYKLHPLRRVRPEH